MAAARPPVVLAVDLGTTSVKAGLVGLDGTMHGLSRAGYPAPANGSGEGHAEQDPETWWAALARVVSLLPMDAVEIAAGHIERHGVHCARADRDGVVLSQQLLEGDVTADSHAYEALASVGTPVLRVRSASAAARLVSGSPRIRRRRRRRWACRRRTTGRRKALRRPDR